jgi:hypothetical protein
VIEDYENRGSLLSHIYDRQPLGVYGTAGRSMARCFLFVDHFQMHGAMNLLLYVGERGPVPVVGNLCVSIKIFRKPQGREHFIARNGVL